MLPELHNKAYQDFSVWLTELDSYLQDYEENQQESCVVPKFKELEKWFAINIASLSSQGLKSEIIGRWQSVHTEIKREFRLLTMDMLFLSAARQQNTQTERLGKIRGRIIKLNNYCQIMNNQKEG